MPCSRDAACGGPEVITYRPFRNTDPPALVETWNAAVASRGSFPIRSPGMMERWVFSKPYFDNRDILVAEQDEPRSIVGFALGGFGPNEDRTGLSTEAILCSTVVRPEFRRQGIGRELTQRLEQSFRARGATTVRFGSQWPENPYLFGIYGGSNSPGILRSEAEAAPFLQNLGYSPSTEYQVYQKKLDTPLTVADARFGALRRRYEAQMLRAAGVGSWWEECVWGTLEPVEMRLTDKLTNLPAARAVVWELEGFSWKWNFPSAGIIDVQVRSDLRRQGLGKLIISQVLRFLQDQFFAIAELQVPANDPIAVGLCQSLGFELVDTGVVYRQGGSDPAPVTT